MLFSNVAPRAIALGLLDRRREREFPPPRFR